MQTGRVRSSTAIGQRKDLKFIVTNALTPKGLQFQTDEDSESQGTTPIQGLRKYAALDNLLSTRPEKEELIQKNIIKENTADSLAAAQDALKKKLLENSLKDKIAARPSPETVAAILKAKAE